MSDLILTISDDEDDQQQLDQTFSTIHVKKSTTQKSEQKKGTKRAREAAEEAEDEEDELQLHNTAHGLKPKAQEEEEEEEEFVMNAANALSSKSDKKKKTAKPTKKKAAEAEAEEEEEEGEEDESKDDEFTWEDDSLPTRSSSQRNFVPYSASQTMGTSLQSKIDKQRLKKKAAKNKDSDDDEEDNDESDISDPDQDQEEDDEVEEEEEEEEEEKEDIVKKPAIALKESAKPKKSSTPQVITPTAASQNISSFDELHLSRPLLKALSQLNFATPTPVQKEVIPHALKGKDLFVNAVTGSGKTAAFMLPILERLLYRSARVPVSRVLVLLPTRELAAQCQDMSLALAKFTNIRIALIVGGLSEKTQEVELRSNPDIILATPGRLIDHLRNTQNVHLETIEILVLDEADRLLELGFQDELNEIIKACPKGRQTMFFSATLSSTISKLVNFSLNDPVTIKIDPYQTIVDRLSQEFIRIKAQKDTLHEREAILLSLCRRNFHKKVIIFVQSKQECHRLRIIFGLVGLKCAELQGNLTQGQRLDALFAFKEQSVDFLICTDLAARGLDIENVETVINMQMPSDVRAYIHRVGRTARAGRSGRAITLISDTQRGVLKELVKKAKDVIHSRIIDAQIIDKYRAKIHDLEEQVRAIFKEENEEKEIRIAEMEANKASNLLVHRDEILRRPAKTWFQSESEKKEAREKNVRVFDKPYNSEDEDESSSLKKHQKEDSKKKKEKPKSGKALAKEEREKERDSLRGLSREKKRRKLMHLESEKAQRAALKEALRDDPTADIEQVKRTLPPTLKQTEERMRIMARGLKKKNREEKQRRLSGMDVEDDGRIIPAVSKKKAKKATSSNGSSSNSSQNTPSHRYAPNEGDGDDRYKVPKRKKFLERYMHDKVAENSEKVIKGEVSFGKKNSTKKGSFKSKSKHKRR